MYTVTANIHSRKGTDSPTDTATIIEHKDNNHVTAEYNGQRYTAIFNPFDGIMQTLYEDNASGKLSDERFMMLSKRYDEEQLALKKKISALQAEIDADEKHKQSAVNFLRTVKRYTDIQELTPVIVNELVEKIVVHQAQGVGKSKTQQFDIHYNFVGVLNVPEVAALPQSILIDTRQGVAVEYITRKAG